MKLLEATYWAAVNDVEDNIAHLAEHCILSQLIEQGNRIGLPFFDCYATTTPSAIIYDLSTYNVKTAEFITDALKSLKPCTKDNILAEIHRIEVEDNIPMASDCNLDDICNEVNNVIAKLKFEPWLKDSNPELDISNKPKHSPLRYGLATREWTLTVKAPIHSDAAKVIADYLATLYLRKPYVYALDNNTANDRFIYTFRTKADYTKEQLQKDLDEVIKLSQSDKLLSLVRHNELAHDSSDLDLASLEFQIEERQSA